jgi:hypothetical protein
MLDLVDGPERRTCATCGKAMDVLAGGPCATRVDGCPAEAACGLAEDGRYVVLSEAAPSPRRAGLFSALFRSRAA